MSTTGVAVTGDPGGRNRVWWWARRRSFALDAGLGVASAAECALEGVPFAREAGLPVGFAVVLGVLAGATLVLRRRWPIAVVLVAIAVTPAEMGVLLGVVGLYTLAASEVPRRITAVLAGMTVGAVIVITFVRMYQEFESHGRKSPFWLAALVAVMMSVGVTLPPLLLGMYAGARRRLVESLRERADGLERELSLLAERAEERAVWARREERTRIAREMHDVVAHRVSLMVVHAAALERVALKDPRKASENAALVGDMGRQALTELREMLGVLRMPQGSVSPGRPAATGGGAAGGGTATGTGTETGAGAAAADVNGAAAAAEVGGGDRGGGGGGAAGVEGFEGVESATGAGNGAVRDAAAGGGRQTAGVGAGIRPRDVAGAEAGGGDAGTRSGGRAQSGSGAADRDREPSGDGEGGSGPSLAELESLIGESRAAGMAVDFAEECAEELEKQGAGPGPYAAEVEQTVYRLVQEALTNVHKHAPGAKTRVLLAHRVGELAVLVVNGPSDAASAGAGLPSGGNGLVGMRERVTALGGGFVSGPTNAGGFRVSAVLPTAA